MSEKLSAFLDGELSEAEAKEVEDALAKDPNLARELETLMAADVVAKNEFAEIGNDPVPLGLAAAIRNAPDARPQQTRPNRWAGIAAAVAIFAISGTGGYILGQAGAPEPQGWLAQIADYHGVYAEQGRHLVEVSAEEADHIQSWLSANVGTTIRIPDLTSSGLTFEGGRLLVAAGQPVAQLMYTDATGRVVALCAMSADAPQEGFQAQELNGFGLVSWGGDGANFVVIGDEERLDLQEIAEVVATQV